jgi:predicted nucleic acid-binding protein
LLVVDSSAVLAVLVAQSPPAGLVDRLSEDGDLHAPHLIDVEVLHALRRLTLRRDLSEDRAADALADFSELAVVRYAHVELRDRVWELRHNLTAYDAAFVALAELLDVPLATCDTHLGLAGGHSAHIELFARSVQRPGTS